jgi:hypothetical protein
MKINISWLSFGKRAKSPLHYNLIRHFGEIIDGITGLIMLPFGRYGTSISITVCENTLIWQMKNRKKK